MILPISTSQVATIVGMSNCAFFFFSGTASYYVAQADLKLLGSSVSLVLVSWVAGTTGVKYQAHF
jgi:hypothetical protein